MAFNKQDYDNQYAKEHYARISALIPKEMKPEVEQHMKNKGFKKMSEYINYLIREDMKSKP